MSRGTEHRSSVHTVEGYLLACAHRDQAQREAGTLCARMPWLTTAQAQDVTRHYVEQRLEVSRNTLREIIERTAQIRQEYEDRYRTLRRDLFRRHAAAACAVIACAAGVGTLTGLLAR
ncbi:hypothetical protein [Streptomyces glaucescens]|uniref:Putative membrane protein n=1 Tax=Streptomyces glaucescens TaxID=1907 RepID=A0A089X337_STRGA|nr:hypothetical protein [Streptomyces glaucescens]AIR96191.1 putative membrane protein [Streptomyces glaucescens]